LSHEGHQYGRLVLELKAIEALLPLHKAQLISYLKAMRLKAGLLINFNVRQLRQGITKNCGVMSMPIRQS
jgi:GxxExxY protein